MNKIYFENISFNGTDQGFRIGTNKLIFGVTKTNKKSKSKQS